MMLRYSVLVTVAGIGVVRHVAKARGRAEAEQRVRRAYSQREIITITAARLAPLPKAQRVTTKTEV
ncbi:hypothetical protein [Roseicyclus sp.]|uniref:hypothetical protein n=1 Tax=Roseicyclus sp. TaxID=1914329 RepID=UPI003F6D69EC